MGFHVLVLAGGSGTRLWPLSRAAVPKHLLPIGRGGKTLLRATVERVLPLGGAVHVVTAAPQADACREALRGLDLGADAVIAEPCARGTGPALGLAVRWIARQDPSAVIASVHADHHINDDDGYRAAVLAAAGWAAATDGLVTIGLTPTYPATGFGYVELASSRPPGPWSPPDGASLTDIRSVEMARALEVHRAAGFVEKPSSAMAERYLADGRHLWNSGLFAWPAAIFERELRDAAPGLDAALAAVVEARGSGRERIAAARYEAVANVAVDPLVFERTKHLTVVRAEFGWSDVGSWSDLQLARQQAGDADADGNVVDGDGFAMQSEGCLVYAHGGRPIVVLGADNLVIVDTGDSVLVVPAARSQGVRDLVEQLRSAGRTELL